MKKEALRRFIKNYWRTTMIIILDVFLLNGIPAFTFSIDTIKQKEYSFIFSLLCALILMLVLYYDTYKSLKEEDKKKKKDELRDKVLITVSKDVHNLNKDKFIDEYIMSYRKVNDLTKEKLSASPKELRNILMTAEKINLKYAFDKGATWATEEDKNKWIEEYYNSHTNIYNISEL